MPGMIGAAAAEPAAGAAAGRRPLPSVAEAAVDVVAVAETFPADVDVALAAAEGGRVEGHGLRRRQRLGLDGDAEDRVGDLLADEAAQLLVELERLALELHERVGAAVAAQADAAAEVVQLGQVLDPQRGRWCAAGRAARPAPRSLGRICVSRSSSACSTVSCSASVDVLAHAELRDSRIESVALDAQRRERAWPGRRCPSRRHASPTRCVSTSASISSSTKPRTVAVRSSLWSTLSRSA